MKVTAVQDKGEKKSRRYPIYCKADTGNQGSFILCSVGKRINEINWNSSFVCLSTNVERSDKIPYVGWAHFGYILGLCYGFCFHGYILSSMTFEEHSLALVSRTFHLLPMLIAVS